MSESHCFFLPKPSQQMRRESSESQKKAFDIINLKTVYLIAFSIHKICDQLKTIPLLTRLLHYHRKVFNNVLLIRFPKDKFRLLKISDFYYRENLLSRSLLLNQKRGINNCLLNSLMAVSIYSNKQFIDSSELRF